MIQNCQELIPFPSHGVFRHYSLLISSLLHFETTAALFVIQNKRFAPAAAFQISSKQTTPMTTEVAMTSTIWTKKRCNK
ncbi:unnamed protein product [Cochlearia groenlandica]